MQGCIFSKGRRDAGPCVPDSTSEFKGIFDSFFCREKGIVVHVKV